MKLHGSQTGEQFSWGKDDIEGMEGEFVDPMLAGVNECKNDKVKESHTCPLVSSIYLVNISNLSSNSSYLLRK